MANHTPDRWSLERSDARDCLVSVLYGGRGTGDGSTPPRFLFQRTIAACRSAQVVVSGRSITGSMETLRARPETSLDTNPAARGDTPAETATPKPPSTDAGPASRTTA
jgi:hypothetical protein